MPTILIVDDRPEARLMMSSKLELMGFAVKTSESATDIVELAVNCLADVVFLDLNMPDIDGCEAAQLLRKDERTWSIPLVMVSSGATVEERELAIQSGCVELISKPIEENLIKDLLARILSATSESEELRQSTP